MRLIYVRHKGLITLEPGDDDAGIQAEEAVDAHLLGMGYFERRSSSAGLK